jgi:hypothetical protein
MDDPGQEGVSVVIRKGSRYLLGGGWSYKTTKHIWRGDSFTEHVITRQG